MLGFFYGSSDVLLVGERKARYWNPESSYTTVAGGKKRCWWQTNTHILEKMTGQAKPVCGRKSDDALPLLYVRDFDTITSSKKHPRRYKVWHFNHGHNWTFVQSEEKTQRMEQKIFINIHFYNLRYFFHMCCFTPAVTVPYLPLIIFLIFKYLNVKTIPSGSTSPKIV